MPRCREGGINEERILSFYLRVFQTLIGEFRSPREMAKERGAQEFAANKNGEGPNPTGSLT